jgi:hypothetical protein
MLQGTREAVSCMWNLTSMLVGCHEKSTPESINLDCSRLRLSTQMAP